MHVHYYYIHVYVLLIIYLLPWACMCRGLAYSENLTDDDEAECESVLGIVPHQVMYSLMCVHYFIFRLAISKFKVHNEPSFI